MPAPLLRKTLRDQRRSLVGWSVGLILLVTIFAALWPSVRDMPGLEAFLENYPEAMRRMFRVEEMSTGAGYLNVELYSIMAPVLFLVFGISRGARLVAGEEEAGTLEVVLATPVPRRRVLLEKAAGLATAILLLAAVLFTATVVLAGVFNLGTSTAHLAGAALAMALLGIEYGALALAVGGATGSRMLALAVPSVLALAGYLLYVLAQFVTALQPWQAVSPFHQALEGGPVGAGLPGAYGWMPLVAVLALALALPRFERRDVGA